MSEPLPLGATIGILGGGQLGRMLALAAARLGFKTHIYCPDKASPAFEVTPHKTVAAYDDHAALGKFAALVDVITYEFENVPSGTAEFLAPLKPLRPGANALAVSQDRLAEKTFIANLSIPVAPHRAIHAKTDLARAVADLGTPAILKTTRLGYDGKGQRKITSLAEAEAAFTDLSPAQRAFYLVLVCLAALSAVVALAPVALHRAVFHLRVKPALVRFGHNALRAALALVSILLVGVVVFVFDVVVGLWAAVAAGVVLGVVILVLWVVVPVFVRRRGREDAR
jgi:5-(carboxyamino)imidazole ribonucleotide synthase